MSIEKQKMSYSKNRHFKGMVKNLETKISRQAYDIIEKYTSDFFRDATLEFYGVKSAKIKELINVQFPIVEVRIKETDIIFLLEDDKYLHLNFQSTYSKENLVRFAIYDLLLYERDKRQIISVVIYSSDVQVVDDCLDTGTLRFCPQIVKFSNYDGNAIYSDLEIKLKSGLELSDHDLLNLIFLPLMKTKLPKDKLAEKSIRMAQSIPNESKRNTCIASIFAFASKYLKDEDLKKLLEVIKVSDLATMLIVDERTQIAKKALKKGSTAEYVAEITGLDIITIQSLKDELDGALPKTAKKRKK